MPVPYSELMTSTPSVPTAIWATCTPLMLMSVVSKPSRLSLPLSRLTRHCWQRITATAIVPRPPTIAVQYVERTDRSLVNSERSRFMAPIVADTVGRDALVAMSGQPAGTEVDSVLRHFHERLFE